MNDKNIKYFHNLARQKKKKNQISELHVEGRTISDTKNILKEFMKWYENLWQIDDGIQVNWDTLKELKWKKLPKESHSDMIKNISASEIELAMDSLGRGKAPALDGFSLEFFLKFWESIKESFMETCCKKSCLYVKEALNYDGELTNQRINYNKSELYFPSAFPKQKKEEITKLMSIKEGFFPFKYLGTNIDKSKLSVNIQRQIMGKAETRLNCWASKNISQTGKTILLNLVVNSIPIHSLATSWINEKVIKEYASLARNYGFHLVNWKVVSLSKARGGLGVKDLSLVKISIHAKRVLPLLMRRNMDGLSC
ncbi:hypothetical protein Cni_G09336 [Canna indica]|uniref:Reverse transcriptase n=1 Tax=Canna indica TaxID=4628 RepID=A0AAQ3K4F2_9LILI|nr:hypothetical protein Cni_G09336 [Canna indica]